MDANEATAARLRAILAYRRISGRELADLMGASPMWAQRRISGAIPLTINDLQRIADALQVPLADLIATEGKATA